MDITDALGGHYVMGYSNRNERIFERNQDSNTWHYTYDELLRLEEQHDPNGIVRTIEYDEVSRVDRVDFKPTGRQHTFAYDDNNNLEVVTRRDGGASPPVPTRFMYDVLDRPIEQSDVHHQTVNYGYDALGRIITKTYPGGKTLAQGFDPLGRLTSQVFDFGPQKFTNAYAYDRAGHLVQRSYPNGVTNNNAFDTAGRLTNLTYTALNSQPLTTNPIQIALSYAYDRNGNKTGATEKGTLDWQLPPLTDEVANYTAAGELKTRKISNTPSNGIPSPGGEGQGEGGTFSYHYDLSGNMTNAVLAGGVGTNARSYALVYDEDNRTTSVIYSNSTPATNVTIANRYDALGRRVSRTMNGAETRYVLDLSGGMERILCDMNTNGVITAWYVHGPDLAFKVDAGGNLTCYHADAQANIIALTGTNGSVLAQYAFTPYGRVLGATNQQSQISNPYLFVGSQGVMEELPGLYFMRARYYSADAAVFLSTDPVKKIGPGWSPIAYAYSGLNPLSNFDPQGTWFVNSLLNSPVTYSASATHGYGVSIDGSIGRDGIEPFEIRSAFGVSLEAAESVEALGFYTGESADWADRRKVSTLSLSIDAVVGLGLSVSRTVNGQWGISLQGSVGFGGGSTFTPATSRLSQSSSPGSTVLYSTTAGTTPMAVLPAASSRAQSTSSSGGGGSGGSSGGQSLSGNASGAAIFGGIMTAINKTPTAAPTSAGSSGGSLGALVTGGSSSGSGNPIGNLSHPQSTPAYVPPSPPSPAPTPQPSLFSRFVSFIGGPFH